MPRKKAAPMPPRPILPILRTPERIELALSLRAQGVSHPDVLPQINALPGSQITARQLITMMADARSKARMVLAMQAGQGPAKPPASIRASLAEVTAWAEQIRADPEASIEDLNADRILRGLLPFDVARDLAPAWTGAAEHLLRQMWAAGTVTKDIGATLNVTKSAVIGKARRLHLTARPNPIATGGASAFRTYRMRELLPGIRTLPLLPSEEAVLAAGQGYHVTLPFWLAPEQLSTADTQEEA